MKTKTKKLYELTPEHRDQLRPWAEKWIANAMSTIAMTEGDREICRDAVVRLYAAAKLPPPKHIVFVPSPFVLRFAGGFAAAIWYRSQATRAATDAATDAATHAATRDATHAATYAATSAATHDATHDATRDATRAATSAATHDATYAATSAATDAATSAATYAATDAATSAATSAATHAATRAATYAATHAATSEHLRQWYVCCDFSGVGKDVLGLDSRFGIRCAESAINMWHGGNQWSAWDSYLTFFRHVAKLELSTYDAYDAWETLSLHSGPRIVHPDFCMISDRPEVLLVDEQNRPHSEDGPFCRWRDGTALFAFHGVYTPAYAILHPESITVDDVRSESNAEVKRILVERMTPQRYLWESGAKLIDQDHETARKGAAPRCLLRDDAGDQWLVGTDGGTRRVYYMPVPRDVTTCRAAHQAICGFDESRILCKS